MLKDERYSDSEYWVGLKCRECGGEPPGATFNASIITRGADGSFDALCNDCTPSIHVHFVSCTEVFRFPPRNDERLREQVDRGDSPFVQLRE